MIYPDIKKQKISIINNEEFLNDYDSGYNQAIKDTKELNNKEQVIKVLSVEKIKELLKNEFSYIDILDHYFRGRKECDNLDTLSKFIYKAHTQLTEGME